MVLSYHRVLPHDSPAIRTEQPTMYVSPNTLDLHLSEIKRHFELVHLDDWLRRARTGVSLPRLACALTFDDGWRDNFEFALPVLRKHGVPAMIFLVSSYVGSEHRFWPNRLMELLRKAFIRPEMIVFPRALRSAVESTLAEAKMRGELRPEDIDRVVKAAKNIDETTIRDLISDAEKDSAGVEATRDLLSAEEVERMAETGLVRFGCHTATHYRFSGRASPEDLDREIVSSKKRVQDICGQSIDVFCYPNGETSLDAVNLVRRHYLGAVTTQKGWHAASGDPHLVRRIGLHEDMSNSRESFLARVSAWL
ncbi:MAG: polysaccharide deacetylase family protein [Steroidobacteraceae bacterium]